MEEIVSLRYKVIKSLGEGSFGSVYLAEDITNLHQVVMKVSPETTDLSAARLEREMTVAAVLSHPNIARILDFGKTKDGRFFLVREYVPGDTLETILKTEGRLGVPRALAIAESIATALREAHKQGFIHRDLKPNNIVVPEENGLKEYDHAKLLDFGVSGDLLRTGEGEGVTRVGEVFGTLRYMSPEQMRGEGQTAATDIWGLGLLLHEMVYGRLPYPTGSITEIMSAALSGNFEIPEEPGIPAGLTKLLRDSLTSDQGNRIQTIDEVISRLDAIKHGTAVPETRRKEMVERDVPIPAPAAPLKIFLYAITGLVAVPVQGTLGWYLWSQGYLNWGTGIGILLVFAGVFAWIWIKRLAKSRAAELGKEAEQVVLGTKSRDILTQSLALQADALMSKLKSADDKLLGVSLALMIQHYAKNKKDDGGAYLMHVVELSEKISARLAPWYVRHDKLVATAVASVTILSGLTTLTIAIINIVKGK